MSLPRCTRIVSEKISLKIQRLYLVHLGLKTSSRVEPEEDYQVLNQATLEAVKYLKEQCKINQVSAQCKYSHRLQGAVLRLCELLQVALTHVKVEQHLLVSWSMSLKQFKKQYEKELMRNCIAPCFTAVPTSNKGAAACDVQITFE